jgi:hypothetical protein
MAAEPVEAVHYELPIFARGLIGVDHYEGLVDPELFLLRQWSNNDHAFPTPQSPVVNLDWSSQRIAALLGVSHHTVEAVRKEMEPFSGVGGCVCVV